ncbi:MAG: hypothetical protein ABIO55_16720 [Ginsengibacter sp.]
MTSKELLPKLYPSDRNLHKTWYVEFTADDGLRKKKYGKLNHFTTLQEGEVQEKRLIDDILNNTVSNDSHFHDHSKSKRLPECYPKNKDLNRTWYIEYTHKSGRRRKIYGQLNHLSTLAQKEEEAKRIMKSIKPTDVISLKIISKTAGNQLINDLSKVFDLRKPG